MVYQWLLANWLRGLVQRKVQETVVDAAREQLAARQEAAQSPCDVAIVFALPEESGGLEDRLEGIVHFEAEGFAVRKGILGGRNVVCVLSGAGAQRAARAADGVIAAHRPQWVISAGFCGALQPGLKRHDLVLGDALLDEAGRRLALDCRALAELAEAYRRLHVGPLLQVDEIVRLPKEKRRLGETHHALAADLESVGVAAACHAHGVPFLAIRVVSDAVDDKLPREVEHLMRQGSRSAQFGAALGAILNRPGSLMDLYQLRENALAASDRLAKFLVKVVGHLAPAPEEA
jgi:adenosylhomocysteine nucleosidase